MVLSLEHGLHAPRFPATCLASTSGGFFIEKQLAKAKRASVPVMFCRATKGEAPMIRSELLKALAKENRGLRCEEVEQVVDVVFDEIAQRLADDGRVELRGFGAFSTRERVSRRGRNPRTGEAVEVPAKRVPIFRPGREMRARLKPD